MRWGEFQRRVPSIKEVTAWWTRWPSANIGLATGELSGVVVLDGDGLEAYTAVLSRGGLEPTPTVVTGKPNGFHWYLKHPGVSVKNFAGDRGVEGLDFRGDGGYVVLPPSQHESGVVYRWHEGTVGAPPRDVPPWLLSLLTGSAPAPAPAPDTSQPTQRIDVAAMLDGVPEGHRDDALFRFACKMRADDVPFEYACVLITEAAARCSPPFPSEAAVSKVREAYRQFKPDAVLKASPPTPSIPVERFKLLTGYEMRNRPRPVFLVDDILIEATLSAIAGAEASYKSFVALDIALSIASGVPWQGRDVIQGPTVYISAEGSAGIGKRIEAWENAHGIAIPDTCYFLPEAVQFLNRGDVDAFLSLLATLPVQPVLIVVDTLARTMVGGEENDARDMGIYVDHCRQAQVATGANMFIVHHFSKAGDWRGSSSLLGALDTAIEARRDGFSVNLHCKKQKDYEEFEDFSLERKVVEISGDETSLIFTTVVGEHDDLKENSRKIGLILFETFGDEGATATQWQQVCEEAKVSRAHFFRGKRELIEKGIVQAQNGGRGAHFVVCRSQGLMRVSEGLMTPTGPVEVSVSKSHTPLRGETMRPETETRPERLGPCDTCKANNWRPLGSGWICDDCFPATGWGEPS